MVSAFLLGLGLMTVAPEGDGARPAPAPASISDSDALRAYDGAKAKVGRDPEAHVRLALWCEQHGLTAERVKHLALAVLTDPMNAAARGLMGLVDYRGKWENPEKVSDVVKADEALTAALAEYNARRDRAGNSADAHWRLALWCEENGLKAEARAHLVTVTRLDPSRESAWKHLGLKKHNGRWVADGQLAEERAEAEARKRADRKWKPLLAKYREWLRDPSPEKQARAEAALSAVSDPLAVPALCAVFVAGGNATDQAAAVPVLGRLDGPERARALALIAVFGASSEVSRAAAETLKQCDGRDVIGLLIGLILKPVKYEVRMVNGPDLPGELFIDGERVITRRVYLPTAGISQQLENLAITRNWAAVGMIGPVAPRPVATRDSVNKFLADAKLRLARAEAEGSDRIRQMLDVSRQQLANDVATLDATNAEANRRNGQVMPVLYALTGQDLSASSDDWKVWWANEHGYVYDRPSEIQSKPIETQLVPNPVAPTSQTRNHHACFAAGTPVKTLEGPKPIETVRIGDQVLAQDVKTGRLMYTPVVAVYHNKPSATFKLKAGAEAVVATGIHRFWKAGHGWTMARDLKPGDVLRTVGGTARVDSVDSDSVQPVFNFEVAEGHSFFVGVPGLLVHDNGVVQPVTTPFDAPANLASLGR